MSLLMSFAKNVSGFVSLKGYEMFECVDMMTALKTLFSNKDFGDWFMILHYDETDPETGEAKTPHIHFFVENKKRKRISTDINDISKALNIDPRAVTCSPCVDQVATAQYFIHKGYEPKKPYPPEDIWTNIDRDLFNLMLNSDLNVMTAEKLQSVCLEAEGSKVLIMKSLGLAVYNKYRWLINDICNEFFGKSYRPPASSQPKANKNA